MRTKAVLAVLSAAACAPPGPTAGPPESPKPVEVAVAEPAADAGAPVETAAEAPPRENAPDEAEPPPADGDPMRGRFTMADATAGLVGGGPLVATIRTDKGDLTCRLLADKAPNTVANFVGLARGLRPFKDPSGAWVTKPAYDGTTFHRVIRGFMIQGGDPKGNGTGEPGYVIPDEIWPGSKHDRAGLLCMANRGPNTNGIQFFVTDASAPHLDGNYTIFGECAPASVVHAIANVPTGPGDRPTTEVVIDSVEISRKAALPSRP